MSQDDLISNKTGHAKSSQRKDYNVNQSVHLENHSFHHSCAFLFCSYFVALAVDCLKLSRSKDIN
jgi:hypothetical protein